MPYTAPDYGILFSQLTIDDYLESLRSRDILRYRSKAILAGDMLELEMYPVYKLPQGKRVKLARPTREAQRNLNHRNTQKRVTRLLHANFTPTDMWGTFTYADAHLPANEEQAKRDITNYIRRLKRLIKKHNQNSNGAPYPELKYIYVTEYITDAGQPTRAHHHIIMNFPDRDNAEALWGKGRTEARLLQPDDYGLEGMARYITKPRQERPGRQASKSYGYSKHLAKPLIATSDHRLPGTGFRMSKRRAAGIAINENVARETFEREYKGYKFNDMQVRYSDYISGAFIHVRMKKLPVHRKGRFYDNPRFGGVPKAASRG